MDRMLAKAPTEISEYLMKNCGARLRAEENNKAPSSSSQNLAGMVERK